MNHPPSKTRQNDCAVLVPPHPELDYGDHLGMVQRSYSVACHLLQAAEKKRSILSCGGFCIPI